MFEVAFVVNKTKHYQAIKSIADEARERGHTVNVTSDTCFESDIVFFVSSGAYTESISTNLSIIMFNGIDEGYTKYKWESSNWRQFDIGLLPGNVSANIWKSKSHWPQVRPKEGVFKTGWPKADQLYFDKFNQKIGEYRSTIGLSDGRTVIYAPTSEDHGKVHEFVQSARPVADNILIKHAPYEEGEYLENESLEEIYSQYESDNDVYILDKNENIFVPLAVSDVLVSDESSVLQEALLTDTVPISVTDWPIRATSGELLSYAQVPEFAHETSRKELQSTLQQVFEEFDTHIDDLEQRKGDHYANLGHSSEVIMDIVEALAEGEDPPVEPVEPCPTHPVKYRFRVAKFKLDRLISDAVLGYLPSEARFQLKRSPIGRVYQKIFRN